MFATYLRLGYEHLLDLQGADHILFIVVLCAGYALARWRELLVLITAFTVGHSVSLALATIGAVRVDSAWVEFLIPVTILATAVLNVFETGPDDGDGAKAHPPGDRDPEAGNETPHPAKARSRSGSSALLLYLLATGFGLIHGLGFSGFLRLLLGDEGSLLVPLLAFNVGLELAQIVVALAALGAAWILVRVGLPHRWWTRAVSLAIGAAALFMSVERWPFP
ncbi:MAG: HupE/UreJ family protein [Gemmatimonadetes bacterium]|nr:HupE/UreJ family protein [Gemmatimonadota bacterium]